MKSAHDCSEGGLAVALAEGCISQLVARETPRLIGAQIDLSSLTAPPQGAAENETGPNSAPGRGTATTRLDALLFGETQGRVVISVPALQTGKVLAQARILGVPAARIGTVGGTVLEIKTGRGTVTGDVHELHDLWWNSIARAME